MLACVYVCLFSVLGVFVIGSDSLAPNENIVRIRCGGGKLRTLLHIFL